MQEANHQSGIYCIENIVNHKKYIGQSKDINNRWSHHISELNRGVHDNNYLQKSWNKYGIQSFNFTVLEYCDTQDLDARESFYIDELNTMNRDCGYNLKSGGQNGGSVFSQEVIQKLSNSIKESYTTELRQLRSENTKEYWNNPENKMRIMGENNPNYGKHLSEEAKHRISIANSGKKSFRRNCTPVLCVETNTKYDDATDASHKLHLDSSCILKVCRGERQICGGYHWQFVK